LGAHLSETITLTIFYTKKTENENNIDFFDYFVSGLGHCLLLAKENKTLET